MTIEQFRSDPERRQEWAKVCALPIFKEAMSVTHDNGPEFEGRPPALALSVTDANIRYGFLLGFSNRQVVLENLQYTMKSSEQLPTTYEPPKE